MTPRPLCVFLSDLRLFFSWGCYVVLFLFVCFRARFLCRNAQLSHASSLSPQVAGFDFSPEVL